MYYIIDTIATMIIAATVLIAASYIAMPII